MGMFPTIAIIAVLATLMAIFLAVRKQSKVTQALTPEERALNDKVFERSSQKMEANVAEALAEKARDPRLATMTQGSYFRAQDGRGLLQAYESIDKLERERILSFQYTRYYEAFHWFALAALVCWLTLIALEATIWRKVP